jgi:hypothetical protein
MLFRIAWVAGVRPRRLFSRPSRGFPPSTDVSAVAFRRIERGIGSRNHQSDPNLMTEDGRSNAQTDCYDLTYRKSGMRNGGILDSCADALRDTNGTGQIDAVQQNHEFLPSKPEDVVGVITEYALEDSRHPASDRHRPPDAPQYR